MLGQLLEGFDFLVNLIENFYCFLQEGFRVSAFTQEFVAHLRVKEECLEIFLLQQVHDNFLAFLHSSILHRLDLTYSGFINLIFSVDRCRNPNT